MTAKRIDTFGGMVPAVDDRLLPDSAAAFSKNGWLYSGAAKGLPTPVEVFQCTLPSCAKVFRLPNNYVDPAHFTDSVWLEFSDKDTDVIRSPVIGDTYDRYYWVSSNDVPRYNTRARIENGDDAFLLGIPAPGTAPTVSASGGASSTNDSRAYVVTWVSAYGEEGAPSPPANITGKIDDTFQVTLPVPAVDDLGVDRNLTKARIYRTVTGQDGSTTFFLVAEVDITDTTYNDTLSQTTITTHSELESTNWSEPPADLAGFTLMPNGMIAGFRKNEVWFCEPYRPHAWPAIYTLTTEYPIVGLGVTGQTLIACTMGLPVAFSGINPASVTESKIQSFDPCLSRGSILSAVEGVYYASPNGLVLCTASSATNVTRTLLTKDKWQSLAQLTSLRAARLGLAYFAYGSPQLGVFEDGLFQDDMIVHEDFGPSYDGILVDPTDARVAFNLLDSSPLPTVNVMNDPWSGEIFVIRDNKVLWLDFANPNASRDPFVWRSKIFQTNSERNFEAMKIFFSVPSTAPEQNPIRNTDAVQTLAADQYGIVRVYADDRLVCTRELRESGELLRLPSGFKADFWQVEFEARVDILSIQLATSAKELTGV